MNRLIKGDKVRVISGKEKGKEGVILSINLKKQTAIVEGINLSKKHQKPTQQNQEGGIVEINRPMPLCKLMLIDPKGKFGVTKVKYGYDKNNKKIRISKKDNSEIGKVSKTKVEK